MNDQSTVEELLDGLAPAQTAVFLDFDGVLVDLAPRPGDIVVAEGLPRLLASLQEATKGALAIVTGRSIADLRAHLTCLPDWVAGSHGGEKRMPGLKAGAHPLTGSAAVLQIQRSVTALERFGEGVLAETKPLGAVIHYRQEPEKEAALRRAADLIAALHEGYECHPAKMAFELRPADVGKDKVVADWLSRASFTGRVPIYFGDDLTDEPAMAVVQRAGGFGIKVGEGETVARHRLTDPASVAEALSSWLERASLAAPQEGLLGHPTP